MFEIKVNEKAIAYTSAPNYIKVLDNGFYGLCKVAEAEGVAVFGSPYGLEGKGLDNLPVAEIEEINDQDFFLNIKDMQDALEVMEVEPE